MTHIACDVGDVEQDIVFPKVCCPGMCVRKTNQAVLQCAQAFRRLLDKIAKATDGEYLKVAFAERMLVVELHNIGNTIIHGTFLALSRCASAASWYWQTVRAATGRLLRCTRPTPRPTSSRLVTTARSSTRAT